MQHGMLTSPGAGPIPGVPAQQPTNLFRYGEITLYSTFNFAATTALANTSNRLFSVALGSQGQGYTRALTITETNLKESGRIPSGQAYDVYGVATQILGSDGTYQDVAFNTGAQADALTNIVNNGALSYDFTQTKVNICPVMLAGAGGGVFGAVSQNAAGANSGALNNGNGGIWAYRKHPVALPGSTTFSVLLEFGTGASAVPQGLDIAVRIVLLGFYRSVIEIGN